MPDEANSHYTAFLEQLVYGMNDHPVDSLVLYDLVRNLASFNGQKLKVYSPG